MYFFTEINPGRRMKPVGGSQRTIQHQTDGQGDTQSDQSCEMPVSNPHRNPKDMTEEDWKESMLLYFCILK